MGDFFQTVADVEATAEDAERLGSLLIGWLVDRGIVAPRRTDCVLGGGGLGHPPGPRYETAVVEPWEPLTDLWTNGVQVETGRQVFHHTGWLTTVACPRCGAAQSLDDLSGTIGRWHGGDPGLRACSGCGTVLALNDWRWDPPWAFGHLGATFWNWPQLAPGFLAEVASRLGHRTVYVYGKV